MFCPCCGAENDPARPLCYRCGASLRHLRPVGPASPGWRGRARVLIAPLLLLGIGLVVILVALVLLFTLTAAPRPLPTFTPLPTLRAAAPSPLPEASGTPSTVLPARVLRHIVEHGTGAPVAGARVVIGDWDSVTDAQGAYGVRRKCEP